MSWVAPSGCNSVYKLNRGLQSFHLGLWNGLISRSFLTNDHQHQYVTIYFYCGLIYWSINNCSYTFTPLTSIKNLWKWQLILKAIGPLELAIHVVKKPPWWRAKIALGQDKQRRLPFKIIHAFCLFCAGETFPLQHRGFVPRNGQLQRAYYRTVRIFKLFWQP